MNIHKKQFNLDKYFSAFYCTESFSFNPKYEIFSQIKSNYTGDWIVIGDRLHDIEIAQRHNLKFIGCAYGYGKRKELEGADSIAEKPEELYSKITLL